MAFAPGSAAHAFGARLLAAGARPVFDSTRIPGEIVDVLVVREEELQRRQQALAALARGWFRAVDYLSRQPEEAHARLARIQGTSAAAIGEMLRGLQFADRPSNLRLLGTAPENLASSFQRLSRLMAEQRLLPAPLDSDRLPTDEVIRSTVP